MLARLRTLACTSMAAVFALLAASAIGPACPFFHYQPELPRRD